MTAWLAAACLAVAAYCLRPDEARVSRRVRRNRGMAASSWPMFVMSVWARVNAKRRQERLGADAARFAHAAAAELRAGRPTAAAVQAAATELRLGYDAVMAAGRSMADGVPVGSAMTDAAMRLSCPRLLAIASACAATEQFGARLADTLDRIGFAYAAEDDTARELAALAAGPRASVLVLAALPGVGLAMGSALGLHPLELLFSTSFGHALAAAAVGLDVLGVWWVRRILNTALRA